MTDNLQVIKFSGHVYCPFCDAELPVPVYDNYKTVRRCRYCGRRVLVTVTIMNSKISANAEEYYTPGEQIKRGLNALDDFIITIRGSLEDDKDD